METGLDPQLWTGDYSYVLLLRNDYMCITYVRTFSCQPSWLLQLEAIQSDLVSAGVPLAGTQRWQRATERFH